MAGIDPYNDGVAIVLELTRPANEADVTAAHALLDEWLEGHEVGDGYRNCGVEAVQGSRRIVVWADRMSDPGGPQAVIAKAERTAEQARAALPVAAWKVTDADDASNTDAVARLGSPVIALRPGGDAVAEVRAAGLLPTPEGLRPAFGWLLPILGVRLLARGFEPPLSSILRNGSVVVGVAALAFLSRKWCRSREQVLAVLACLAAAAMLVFELSRTAPQLDVRIPHFAVLIVGLTWAGFWLKRGQ